ncbi:hypothetical protein [Streptomyces spirodelae]|uniref:Uncharacterized protein n=1 Tax=Streptomyces spirodelae TaxID=2812904 RepID=A0ABS3X1J2_9ACTN|nr:hypothetical protein [Streptomyces spirodelae]MBO8189248.1 hypothetical protein [Streptomyces spirodelae]
MSVDVSVDIQPPSLREATLLTALTLGCVVTGVVVQRLAGRTSRRSRTRR